MRRAERTLSSRHAVALGLLHGPTELLPISSSAHTTLIPWLAGSSYAELDPPTRKSFEVALHAGTALALAWVLRGALLAEGRALDARRAAVLALALAPPALAGFALRETIERQLGGPGSIAAGLAAGALAMAWADRAASDVASENRPRADARPLDGLALGLAQAVALAPGVSRSGATLTAARARGFARADAQELSWVVGLPVLAGASALEAQRLLREPLASATRMTLVLGGAISFCSTLVSARLLHGRGRALLPYSLYRLALAAFVASRLRGGGSGR